MSSIKQVGTFSSTIWNKEPFEKKASKPATQKEALKISNTAKVYDKLDKFLNLGAKDRLDISELNSEEKKEFFKMLSQLIKKGVVGYEVLDIKGKGEKHYIETRIGNERLKNAKLYNKKDLFPIKKSN